MFTRLDRCLNWLYHACGLIAAAFISVIVLLVLINIGSRVVGTFVPGMTEMAGYAMAAAGAFGLAYTFGERGHIRVTMVIDVLRGRGRFYVELWSLGIATILAVYLAVFFVRMVYVSWLFDDRSDGSDELLIWIPQVPTAIGFVVFAICLVHATVKAVAAGKVDDGGPATTGH
ncbi:MAG: TRAP transporter small permease subunit [Alphaproteobacteria bacterium]|nr:TRAP transporter small permease subunit [Alphaproteobacteria bacterium]